MIGLGEKTRPQRLTLTLPALTASTSCKTTHLVPPPPPAHPHVSLCTLFTLYPHFSSDCPFFFQRTTHLNHPPSLLVYPSCCLNHPFIYLLPPPPPPQHQPDRFFAHAVRNGSHKIPVTIGDSVRSILRRVNLEASRI